MNGINEDVLQRKKNLKWFHSRIEDFNKNVPHQINTLTTCRKNMCKQYRLENFAAVRQEKMQADRAVRSLKQLLSDVDELRKQVVDADLDKFDKLVDQSRRLISNALNSFTQYCDSLPQNNGLAKSASTSSSPASNYGSVDAHGNELQKQVLMQVEEDTYQDEVARQMKHLEEDSQALNVMYKELATIIGDQREYVDRIETNVEETHAHVISAQRELAQAASKLRGAAYPLVGAIIGSCVGGPIGFVAGLKVGSVVAVTGSVIGYSGGQVLRRHQQQLQKKLSEDAQQKKVSEDATQEKLSKDALIERAPVIM